MDRHLSVLEFDDLIRGQGTADARTHAEMCPQCGKIWQELVLAHALLSRAHITPAPDGFHERVMQALHTEETSRAPALPSRLMAGLGVAILGGSLVLVALTSGVTAVFLLQNAGRVILSTLAMLGTVLANVWRTAGNVVWLIFKAGGVGPWMMGVSVGVVVLVLLTAWLTHYYSRKLYPTYA